LRFTPPRHPHYPHPAVSQTAPVTPYPDPQLRVPPFTGVDPIVSHGGAAIYCVDVAAFAAPAPALPLSVSLVWTDPPGSPLAAYVLVNNLDLEVTPPGLATLLGNNNASQRPQLPDALNNVEKVYLPAPPPTLAAGGARIAAPYTVLVRGVRVPQGPQAFSLVVSGPGVRVAPAGTAGCGGDPAAPAAPPAAAAAAAQQPLVVALASTAGVLGALLLGVLLGAAACRARRPQAAAPQGNRNERIEMMKLAQKGSVQSPAAQAADWKPS